MAFKFPPLTPEEQERMDAREAEEASRIPITARFTRTTGRWNKFSNEYDDITETSRDETIHMKVIHQPSEYSTSPFVLQFYGAPTGYEAYRLEDQFVAVVQDNSKGDDFCICGGTINEYDQCVVNRKDIFDYLTKEGY